MDLDPLMTETIAEIKGSVKNLEIAAMAFSRKRLELDREYVLRYQRLFEYPPDYWRHVALHDALLKFLEFAESDLENASSLDLTQKARYAFDSIAWVKHLCNPRKDALDYVAHLLRGMRHHYKTVTDRIKDEVIELRELEKTFNLQLYKYTMRRIALGKPPPPHSELDAFITEFDKSRNTTFSIYRRSASGNYGALADDLEVDVLARYAAEMEQLELDVEKFEAIRGERIPKRHRSDKFAESVGMKKEYDFIFSLASQHMHATPVSMSTDMRDISSAERLIVLEFIAAKIRDVLSDSLYLMNGFKRAVVKPPGLGTHFSATRRGRRK